MKEHPIIFSSEMVRAILDGRKTQTRRIAKLPEKWHRGFRAFENNPNGAEEFVIHGDCGTETTYCPYGQVGDRLWVRETFWYCCDGCKIPFYKADGFDLGAKTAKIGGICHIRENTKWKPSIHMPRWVARIFLEITNIRVERVQDISQKEAIKEGIQNGWYDDQGETPGRYLWFSDVTRKGYGHSCPKEAFKELWDSLNTKRGYGWDKNPWVWVIEFKKS